MRIKERIKELFHKEPKVEYVEDGIHGWIAKDRNKKLNFFKDKPRRNRDVWWAEDNPHKPGAWLFPYTKLPLPVRDMFHYELKWEDEPVECDIIFRIKKK